MAAAGPAAIAGAVLMIGQGIYGMFKGRQARDKRADAQRKAIGELWTGAQQISDPTGVGHGTDARYGSGRAFTYGGSNYYIPVETMGGFLDKVNMGEYNQSGNYTGPQGTNSLLGYRQNQSGDWEYGQFSLFGEGGPKWTTGVRGMNALTGQRELFTSYQQHKSQASLNQLVNYALQNPHSEQARQLLSQYPEYFKKAQDKYVGEGDYERGGIYRTAGTEAKMSSSGKMQDTITKRVYMGEGDYETRTFVAGTNRQFQGQQRDVP